MQNPLKTIIESDHWTLRRIGKLAQKVINQRPKYEKYTDEQLKQCTNQFEKTLQTNPDLDALLVDAYAVVGEAAYRVLGMRPYKVQIMGGIILNQGNLAEMKTGEGKTLTATMPVYLNALSQNGVHVITVNEYLSKRDAEEMGVLYNWLGLSVGVNAHDKKPAAKKAAYACDIMYSTNSEIGFDYLRDNMAEDKKDLVQRPFNYALIDEVDSVLIDEAKTPLIISGGQKQKNGPLNNVDQFVKLLHPASHFQKDPETKVLTLTNDGILKAQHYFHIDNLYDRRFANLNHAINQALTANFAMDKDHDYLIKDGEIQIIDSFTGRSMSGRRFSDGLHQALEAKEHVKINDENKTMASITYQNLFRMYPKLSGMTGTGRSQKEEFNEVYHLDVISVPTNKPVQRIDKPDRVFLTTQGKFHAVLNLVKQLHANGQPILIGSASVNTSEHLSKLLTAQHLKHTVLNAKDDQKEAAIVKDAGQLDAITIATNMASRGTDIKLTPETKKLGGLAVIGTERHESKRIDDQLRGRAGRQSDPGFSQFFVSYQDDLLKQYGSKLVKKQAQNARFNDLTELTSKHSRGEIDNAQIQVEGQNYASRKDTLKYDAIIREQRHVFYQQRKQLLNSNTTEFKTLALNIANAGVDNLINPIASQPLSLVINKLKPVLPEPFFKPLLSQQSINNTVELKIALKNRFAFVFNQLPLQTVNETLKPILLQAINESWADYLSITQQLQSSIQYQSYAQRDPVIMFQHASYQKFESMINKLEQNLFSKMLNGLLQLIINNSN